jgi:methylmalonyl-CoA mutase
LTRSTSPLAEGFPPATRGDWLALVEKTLKGAHADTLVTKGPDDLAIQPLYEEVLGEQGFAIAPRGGGRAWDIRARIRHPNATAAHDALLEELSGGAASVIVALDGGQGGGVVIDSAEALAQLLDGVLIDVAPVALDAGFLGPTAADWLSAAAKGSPAAPLAFHLDPLSAFALSGESPGPIESHLIASANLAARLTVVHPRASFHLASGTVVHEAGGSPAQELAFGLAAALIYAKSLTRAGLSMTAAFRVIALGLAVDGDPLISIAKLRAARLIWTRLTLACGAATPAVIEARSSRRMLTWTEPWTNMVRLTAAGFAAAVGGADAVVLGAFTDALGLPTAFARRAARNTQLILMEEGHLGAVCDPVAGSGAFEALSRDLAKAAWARFNAIEASGGLIRALREGLVAQAAERSLAELTAGVANGDTPVIGVTDFRAPEIRAAAVDPDPGIASPPSGGRLPGPDSACPALAPILLEELAA